MDEKEKLIKEALYRYVNETSSSNTGTTDRRLQLLQEASHKYLESTLKIDHIKGISKLQSQIDNLLLRVEHIDSVFITEERAGEIAFKKIGFVLALFAGFSAVIGLVVTLIQNGKA